MEKKTNLETLLAPPTTDAIERDLLAAIIANPDQYTDARGVLIPEHFSNENARDLWALITARYESRMSFDSVCLLPIAPNREYFVREIVPKLGKYTASMAVNDMAYTLARAAEKRIAFAAACEILQLIQGGAGVSDIRQKFDGYGERVGRMYATKSTTATEYYNKLCEALQADAETIAPTGIISLDAFLDGGFKAGTLNILAARPSVGKTTLALEFAENAVKCGVKTAVFSLEQTGEELVKRLLTLSGKVTKEQINPRSVDWSAMETAAETMITDNLIIDADSYSIDKIITSLDRLCRLEGVQFVVIDYLGLIESGESRDNLAYRIGAITRRLKIFAKRARVPVLLLCQLSRNSAQENRPPEMYDLRDSGSIEQDADAVVMLDLAKDLQGNILPNEINLYLRKNRGGERTLNEGIRLYGNAMHQNFTDVPPTPEKPVTPATGNPFADQASTAYLTQNTAFDGLPF